jgi:predicted HAD superfamily Cof-like phosphohydrolase
MQKQLQQLIEWHTSFDVPYAATPVAHIPAELRELRTALMVEEVNEWNRAFFERNGDIERQKQNRAKELADILYTVFGTIITEGLQDVMEQVFDEVHKSNMSKRGDDGKPLKSASGKVLKGANYKEPDLSFVKITPYLTEKANL